MPGARGMRQAAAHHIKRKTKQLVSGNNRSGYKKLVTDSSSKDNGSLEQIVKSITSPDKNDPSFAILEENDSSVVLDRIERIEKIIALKKEMVSSQLDDGRDEVELEKKLTGLLEKVERRISNSHNYFMAISLVCFCGIYARTLILQTNNEAACSVEGSVINNIIYSLPGGIQGGFLTSTDDFWAFMNQTLISGVFVDSACGDGKCSLPDEYPGFGRFGCIPDCGRYVQTTTITVDLRSFAFDQSQYHDDLDPCDNLKRNAPCRYLGGVKQSNVTNPQFKFNIYSATMNDYLWAQDQDVNKVLRVEVPDGDFRLELYQTRKTSEAVDVMNMYQNLYVLPSTVPARAATQDYFYGDPREYLAATSALLSDISDYCWGGNQALHNYACDWHPTLDTVVTALASYGVSGKITMASGMRKTTTLAKVDYCSALPNGTLGLTEPANRELLRSYGVACPARRRASPGVGALAAAGGEGAAADAAAAIRAAPGSAAAAAGEEGPQHVRAGQPFQGVCSRHSDCDRSLIDPFTSLPGSFCANLNGGTCMFCSFCQSEATDAIDGKCLQRCNVSAGFPDCLDAAPLAAAVTPATCPNTYTFSVYRFNPEGSPPTVSPPTQPKLPEITPHNFVVGPITVSQVRRRQEPCDGVQSYSLRVFANATTCAAAARDPRPYGVDPTFLSASSIYNGKLQMADFYAPSEIYTKTTSFPSGATFSEDFAYGFFPHRYSAAAAGPKNASEVSAADAEGFKLYFDGVLSLTQAQKMLSYMREGGFIDAATASIDVDFITFNPTLNLFSTVTVFFIWQTGGSISWDFKQHTQGLDIYSGDSGSLQYGLEILCLLLLALFSLAEIWEAVAALRKLRVASLLTFGRLLDWTHWILMGYAWGIWYRHVALADAFAMRTQPEYWVLNDPGAYARLFATNSTNEINYLKFQSAVNEYIYASGEYYNSVCSCSIIIFVLRVLKSFGFQVHLGVITRTFSAASSNLLHFMFLVFAVFIGFSVSGHLIFGHEFQQMSTVGDSMTQHFWMLLTLDATTFYDQMYHAAPPWIFHLYCWSFVLLCGFLLINIFLAILVDAYIAVRSTALSSMTLAEDVWDVAGHAMRAALYSRRVFMSDWELRDCLYKVLNQTQQQKTVLPQKSQVLQLLMNSLHKNDRALHLPGGLEINGATLSELGREIDQSALLSHDTPFSAAALPPPKPDPNADPADPDAHEHAEGELQPWVDEIMERYSDPIDAIKLEQSVIEDIRAEGLKRDLFTYRAHQRIHDAVVKVSSLLDLLAGKVLSPAELRATRAAAAEEARAAALAAAGGDPDDLSELLQVSVLEAQALPRKDLIRSVDPFCLLCLVADRGDPTGRQTYKTRVVAGDRNPRWQEQFVFPLPPAPAAGDGDGGGGDGPMLTVILLDYDKCSTNDLIGCVSIDITAQVPKAPGFLEDWFPVINKMDRASVKLSRLKLKLERLVKVKPPARHREKERKDEDAGGE